jgi:hypothetical protein
LYKVGREKNIYVAKFGPSQSEKNEKRERERKKSHFVEKEGRFVYYDCKAKNQNTTTKKNPNFFN